MTQVNLDEARSRRVFETVSVSIWEEDFSQVKAAIDVLKMQGVTDFLRYFAEHPAFVDQAIEMVRIVDVNPATMKLLGAASKAELVVSLQQVFMPETRDIFVGELLAIAEGREEFSGETVLRRRDGTVLNVIVTMSFPQNTSYSSIFVLITDITPLKHAQRQTQGLQDLVSALSQTLTVNEIAQIILTRGLEAIGAAAGSIALLLDDGKTLELVQSLGYSETVSQQWQRFDVDLPNVTLSIAARTQELICFSSFEERMAKLPGSLPSLADPRYPAVAAAPLVVNGRSIGSLGFSFTAERPFDPQERAFILSVAHHCAQAIDRSQAYEAEARMRREAEKAADYVRRLQKVSTALASALTVEQVAKVIVDQGLEITGALTGSFQLLIKDGTAFTSFYLAKSLMGEAEKHKWQEYPASPVFPSTDAVRTKQALWFERSAEVAAQYPVLSENAKRYPGATVLMPVVVGERAVGVINYVYAEPRVFREDEKAFLLALTDQCAIAVERAQLYEAEQEARAKAEKADFLKLQFLGMISHELRTPLTSIKGFATTLLADDVQWAPENQREFLAVINEESDKLTDLIEQLLDLSRLEAGALRINPELQPMEMLLEDSRPVLARLVTKHPFSIQRPEKLPSVVADTKRITQVLANLVQNAAKYSPADAPITLTIHDQGETIQFDVSDEGIGIPVEERERVFQAFWQVERKFGNMAKGAGLGLAICRGLVEAHGGKIWIQDLPVPGTTVSFTLPVQPSPVRSLPLPHGEGL